LLFCFLNLYFSLLALDFQPFRKLLETVKVNQTKPKYMTTTPYKQLLLVSKNKVLPVDAEELQGLGPSLVDLFYEPVLPNHSTDSDMSDSGTGSSTAAAATAGESELLISRNSVLRDGYMPVAEATRVYSSFLTNIGMPDDKRTKARLAIACCYGTSANLNMRERLLDATQPHTSLDNLVLLLNDVACLNGRTNKLRVFCRSLPGFAKLTFDTIRVNTWLSVERARACNVEVEFGRLCFDYADALAGTEVTLTPIETGVMIQVTREQVGQARGHFATGGANNDSSAATEPIKSAVATGRGTSNVRRES
jgi:hypothetical protein